MTMKQLPRGERPRERMLERGPKYLTDAELVALLIGTGHAGTDETALDLARRLLRNVAGSGNGSTVLRRLAEASPEEMTRSRGIGPAKAATIMAAVELGKRVRGEAAERPIIRGPGDVAEILIPQMASLDREHFRVVLLNTKNGVLDVETVAVGGLDASIAHPREVFKAPIRRSAAAIILAHNHPSGDPSPSTQDARVTRRMIRAGNVLGVEVLDHVIIGDDTHYSMRERGMEWEVANGQEAVLEGE